MKADMISLIKELNALRVNCYMRKTTDTWAICERDGLLGYVQTRNGYRHFSTVHVPHISCGSGYAVDSMPQMTLQVDSMFSNRPAWAAWGDTVVKYTSIEQYKNASNWNKEYELVVLTGVEL